MTRIFCINAIETVMLPMMKSDINGKYLGLHGSVGSTKAAVADAAQQSVYFWWWAFLRLSPVLWFARETGATPKDKSIARVVENSGNLGKSDFRLWWNQTGRFIYAESQSLPVVEMLGVDDEVGSSDIDDEYLYLKVPLSISRVSIIKQIRSVLNSTHDGRDLDLMKNSSAYFKPHTKRYRLRSLENEYWVLLYRLMHERAFAWQIGDRLQIAPHLKVREGIEVAKKFAYYSTPRDLLGNIAGRHLYKARFTLLNMERGEFPNCSEIRLSERYQPFGLKLQSEFREATETRDGKSSEWHDWLRRRFTDQLRTKVMECNRLRSEQFTDAKSSQKLTDFISGSVDLLI